MTVKLAMWTHKSKAINAEYDTANSTCSVDSMLLQSPGKTWILVEHGGAICPGPLRCSSICRCGTLLLQHCDTHKTHTLCCYGLLRSNIVIAAYPDTHSSHIPDAGH